MLATATPQTPQQTPQQTAAQFPYPTPIPPSISPNDVIPPADYVPPEQPPQPGAEDHLAWLHHKLKQVSSIMGGDETWKVTKAADGTTTAEPMPSTEKEKWGRIAAAVIGGALKGMGAGQGPGGAGKALAAGGEFGMQIPQQQKENVQKDVTQEQKTQLFNANMAALHQKAYTTMLANRALEINVGKEDAQLLSDYDDETSNSPGSKDYGTVTGWEDLKRIKDSPSFMDDHTNGSLQVLPVRGKDGKLELHAVSTDSSSDNAPVAPGTTMPRIDIDPKTGEPILKADPVARGTKNAPYRAARTAKLIEYFTAKNNFTNAQARMDKANQEKVPPTYQAAAVKARNDAENEPDPGKKQVLLNSATQYDRLAAAHQAAGKTTINNTPSSPQAVSNWSDLLANPASNTTMAQVKPADRNAVIADMKARGLSPSHPLTAKELDRSDLANNALDNLASAQAIWQKRPDLFGPAGYGKSKMQQALEGGDQDALAFQTAINLANLPAVGIHGVRGRWALEDLAKYDSNLWLNHDSMGRVLGEIHRSVNDFAPAGGRRPLGGATPPPGGGTTQPNANQPGTTQQGAGGFDFSKFPKAQ
jgi:hypothetical protein